MVPLVSRLKLGSVLGYMAAGILIGPHLLGLIEGAEQVMHFAEFGVVMMLFLIGLELEPAVLWRMRRAVLGLGGAQVVLTIIALAAIALASGLPLPTAIALASALALSSTALVLQMLSEKDLLQTSMGEHSFSVLLFQDIAVIPMLVLLPMLAAYVPHSVHANSAIAHLPSHHQALIVIGVIAGIILGGRYISRHMFRFIARANLREVFTATSLALVVGITLVMQALGVSPALGAFIAGVMLANSEYRHTLEVDIKPFKGLLLGLFFISVGMGMNFSLFAEKPAMIASLLVLLMATKCAILWLLARAFRLPKLQAIGFSLALCQGGEFAFVLLQFSQSMALIDAEISHVTVMVVACSMALTPVLMGVYSYLIVPKFLTTLPARDYDIIETQHPIILAGYGRFGQIIGRFLHAQGIKVVVLEKDPEQLELLRKFGFQGYYGDASDVELLRAAGAEKARMIIIGVANVDVCLDIAQKVKRHFPQLKMFVRARNRRHAYELDKIGVEYFRRDVFDAALIMAQEVMVNLGFKRARIQMKARQFAEHDEDVLKKSFAFFDEEHQLIDFSKQATEELERLLKSDAETAS